MRARAYKPGASSRGIAVNELASVADVQPVYSYVPSTPALLFFPLLYLVNLVGRGTPGY
jgi:hypothetical protein